MVSKRERQYQPLHIRMASLANSLEVELSNSQRSAAQLSSSANFFMEQAQDPRLALEVYVELFEKDPCPKWALRIAVLYRDQLQEYESAIDWFKKSTEVNEKVDTEAMCSIAQIFKVHLHDNHQAISWFEESLVYETDSGWVASINNILDELYDTISPKPTREDVDSYLRLQEYRKDITPM